MQPPTCARADCTNVSVGHVHLKLHPEGYAGVSEPVDIHFNLPVCQPHADTLTADDVVSDEGWAQLTAVFMASNLWPPSRETMEVTWLTDAACASLRIPLPVGGQPS